MVNLQETTPSEDGDGSSADVDAALVEVVTRGVEGDIPAKGADERGERSCADVQVAGKEDGLP